MTHFSTPSLENFECLVYDKNNLKHKYLLEKYFESCQDAPNNISHERLKTYLYDHTNGILFMVINKTTMTIDGISSCAKFDNTARLFHRFHMKPNIPWSVGDRFIEYESYDWAWKNGFTTLWFSVNLGHEETLFLVSKRMGRRRNGGRPNIYKDSKYDFIRQNWRPHNRLMWIRGCWQYVIYYSPDNKLSLNKQEMELSSEVCKMFKKEFPDATYDW